MSVLDPDSYTADEKEFIAAVEAYKKQFNKRFLTIAEHHHILMRLGYAKVFDPAPLTRRMY